MTDKERLGKIKALLTQRDQHIDEEGQIDYHEYDHIIYELNDFVHIDWLINRVEKLEIQLSINTNNMKQLQKENERYKQRIEELELEINDWRAEVQKWQQFYKESEESHLETKELLKSIVNQNKRYKQALEFYADEETYETKFATDTDEIFDPFTLIELDNGEKARKALEGTE